MTEKERFEARVAKMKLEDGLVSLHISTAEGVDRDSEEFWAEVNKWQDRVDAEQYTIFEFNDADHPTVDLNDL